MLKKVYTQGQFNCAGCNGNKINRNYFFQLSPLIEKKNRNEILAVLVWIQWDDSVSSIFSPFFWNCSIEIFINVAFWLASIIFLRWKMKRCFCIFCLILFVAFKMLTTDFFSLLLFMSYSLVYWFCYVFVNANLRMCAWQIR